MACTRTDIETPHAHKPKTPFVIAPAEYPSHIVRKGDGVCSKAVRRERTPHRRLAPIYHRRRRRFDILYIGEMRDHAKPCRRVGDRNMGSLATVAESDVQLASALGVARQQDSVPFVGESAGV